MTLRKSAQYVEKMTRATSATSLLALLLLWTAPSCKKDPPATPTPMPAAAASPSGSAKGPAAGVPGALAAVAAASEDAGPPATPPPPAPAGPGDLIATIDTSMGAIQIRLFEDKAPQTVANFVGLADGSKQWKDPRSGQQVKKPFYDGQAFSRVAPGLVVQAGDPKGDGSGDPGFVLPDEFHPSLRHSRSGVVTMANRGKHTNGSQFMITLRALPLLDNRNSVFGEVVAGMEVVEAISRVPALKQRPQKDVVIRHIEIKKLAAVVARSPG